LFITESPYCTAVVASQGGEYGLEKFRSAGMDSSSQTAQSNAEAAATI